MGVIGGSVSSGHGLDQRGREYSSPPPQPALSRLIVAPVQRPISGVVR